MTFQATLRQYARNVKSYFLFFPENGIWHLLQDNLHEMLNPIFFEKLEK